MGRRASGFFGFLFILLIAAGFGFYVGYSPLHIPHDSVGVLVSKTSGVSSKPVVPGVFQWDWELLLPTNATIRSFSLKPYSYSKIKTGMLPEGDVYSKLLQENPSFNYSASFDVELKVDPKQCVELVKESDIATDSDLQKKNAAVAEEIVETAFSMLLKEIIDNPKALSVDVEKIKEQVIAEYQNKNISISSLNISNVKIPDVELYSSLRDMYLKYVSDVESALQKQVASQARDIAENTKNLNKLEKFGKVLKDNPQLADFLKSSKDMNETLKSIYTYN